MTLIEAVRGEVAAVEQRLGVLREVEALLAGLDDAVPPVLVVPEAVVVPVAPVAVPAKEKARVAPKAPSSRAGGGVRSEAVLRVLRQHGDWVRGGDIVLPGLSDGARRQHVAALLRRGVVEARGPRQSREYRAVQGDPVPPPAVIDGDVSRQEASVLGRVLDAVGWEPNTARDVAARLGIAEAEVQAALGQLVRDGDVERMDSGKYRAVAT